MNEDHILPFKPRTTTEKHYPGPKLELTLEELEALIPLAKKLLDSGDIPWQPESKAR